MRALLLAIAVAVLLGLPAAADPPSDRPQRDWRVKRLEHGMFGGMTSRTPSQPPDEAPDHNEQAEPPAPAQRRLGFFADRMTFRVLQQGAGLDLRGGAYLQLLRNLSLRGSYRVFDYDRLGGDSSSEKDYHGPLFGLDLSF